MTAQARRSPPSHRRTCRTLIGGCDGDATGQQVDGPSQVRRDATGNATDMRHATGRKDLILGTCGLVTKKNRHYPSKTLDSEAQSPRSPVAYSWHSLARRPADGRHTTASHKPARWASNEASPELNRRPLCPWLCPGEDATPLMCLQLRALCSPWHRLAHSANSDRRGFRARGETVVPLARKQRRARGRRPGDQRRGIETRARLGAIGPPRNRPEGGGGGKTGARALMRLPSHFRGPSLKIWSGRPLKIRRRAGFKILGAACAKNLEDRSWP